MQLIGDAQYNFFEIYNNIKNNTWTLPSWQREKTWSSSYVLNWGRSIFESNKIPAFFILGKIKGEDRIFINDGAQRSSHSLETIRDNYIKEFIKKHKLDKIQALNMVNEYLSKCLINVATYEYDSEEEAQRHFVTLNVNNTRMTCYELIQPHLNLYNLTSDQLKFYKKDISNIVNSQIQSINNKNPQKIYEDLIRNSKGDTRPNRKKLHVRQRDDLALFARFANKNNIREDYSKVSADSFNEDEKDRIIKPEISVLKIIEQEIYEDLISISHSFEEYLTSIVADLKENLKTINMSGVTIPDNLLRWYFNWHIINVYHLKMNKKIVNDFTQKLFTKISKKDVEGNIIPICTSINEEDKDDGNKIRFHFSFQVHNKMETMSKYFNCPDLLKSDKRSKYQPAKGGLDNCHQKPFSEYGEGKVCQYPRSMNRSSGAAHLDKTLEEFHLK